MKITRVNLPRYRFFIHSKNIKAEHLSSSYSFLMLTKYAFTLYQLPDGKFNLPSDITTHDIYFTLQWIKEQNCNLIIIIKNDKDITNIISNPLWKDVTIRDYQYNETKFCKLCKI